MLMAEMFMLLIKMASV